MKKFWKRLPRYAHVSLIGAIGALFSLPLLLFPRLSELWLIGVFLTSIFGGVIIGGNWSDPGTFNSQKEKNLTSNDSTED